MLFVTNGLWLYRAVDLAVTEAYRQQEEYETQNRLKTLQGLCSKLIAGIPKAEAAKLLNELSPEVESYENDGRLNITWLSVNINDQGNVALESACN